jgi:hypothetical protein
VTTDTYLTREDVNLRRVLEKREGAGGLALHLVVSDRGDKGRINLKLAQLQGLHTALSVMNTAKFAGIVDELRFATCVECMYHDHCTIQFHGAPLRA